MRDLIVLVFFIASLPLSLRNPVLGVIFYALASYLNPHRLAWGYVFSLPLAKGIATATLIGYFLYRGDKKLPLARELFFIFILWALACFGWFFSLNPEGFVEELERFTKILLMIYVTVGLIKTKKDLRWLVLVIILSIGFYDLKGAVWGLRGGSGWVKGPSGSFFGGNNEMGLVINMVWPFYLFLSGYEKNKWVKRLLLCLFWVSPLTVILTKSRGAALAMAVTAFFLFQKVKNKAVFIIIGCFIIFATIPFIPAEWSSRMQTIETYKEDKSAMGRINAWWAAWYMALDRPFTGGGLSAFTPETIYRYAPDPENYHDVHSIYFEVLGEMGFPGIIVYLSLIGTTLMTLRGIIKQSKILPEGDFYKNYATAIYLGLIGYLVNGAFLGLAFFDLFYQYIGIAVSLKVILQNELQHQEAATIPNSRPLVYFDKYKTI